MASRRDLFDPTDPGNRRPEQRLAEVAAILAVGAIRMRERPPEGSSVSPKRGPASQISEAAGRHMQVGDSAEIRRKLP